MSGAYYGTIIRDAARERIGDLIICARDDYALYDMRRQKERGTCHGGAAWLADRCGASYSSAVSAEPRNVKDDRLTCLCLQES